MRLPFMQIESDFVSHGAALLGQLAGCPTPHALGHLAMLRAWAVSQATDETPPTGWVGGEAAPRIIEAAAQWSGEKGRLFQALVDARQVQVEESGARILHLEPYAKAWERNAKNKARMAHAREQAAINREHAAHNREQPTHDSTPAAHEPQSDGAQAANGMRKTQTQTQTQTQNETTDPPPPPVGGGEAVGVEQPELALGADGFPVPVAPRGRRSRAPDDIPPEVLALQALWNEFADRFKLQRWLGFEGRLVPAKASMAAVPDISRWRAFLEDAMQNPFNLGQNDRNWQANVEWLLRVRTRAQVQDFDPSLARTGRPAVDVRRGNVPAEHADHKRNPITEL